MNLLFDARILTHKHFTGVENYSKAILNQLEKNLHVSVAKPKTTNRYLAHLWTHFVLAFMKADILFSPANIAPFFIPKKKKLVLTIHDVAFLTFSDSFSLFFRLYYRFVIPINIKRADKIITISEYSKKEIISFYPKVKDKIKVISLGVDTIYKNLNIKKKNQILYVGSLNKRKNFIGVIRAFEMLESDVKLCIVGNFDMNFKLNEEDMKLLQNAKKNKNIIFKQNVSNEELLQIYNESKVFLFPSFYEGFGLPILESMACGTPVITSDISSMPEIGSEAVLYCNPYEINSIKEKIELLLNDEELQKKMIKKGLLHVKKFTWEKSAQKHIEVFEEVLEK